MAPLTQFPKLNTPKRERGHFFFAHQTRQPLQSGIAFSIIFPPNILFLIRILVVLVLPALPPCRMELKIGVSQQKIEIMVSLSWDSFYCLLNTFFIQNINFLAKMTMLMFCSMPFLVSPFIMKFLISVAFMIINSGS